MTGICGKSPQEEERLHQKAQAMDMDNTNIILVVLQMWLSPLISLGSRYSLTTTDIPPCPTENQTDYVLSRFYTYWAQSRRKALKVFFQSYLSHVIISGIAEFLFYGVNFGQPYLIKAFVRYFERAEDGLDAPHWEGVLYSLGLAAVAFVGATIVMVKFYHIFRLAIKIRAAIMAAVFEKSLIVAPSALGDMSRGTIMNLMSNDSMRAFEFCIFFHVLWSSPLCIIVAMILMYFELKTPAFVAIGLMVLLFPFQILMARLIRRYRLRTIKLTDMRLKLTNEILENIRIIKLYAWEASMADKLSKLREQEVSSIRTGLFLRTLNQITLMVWPGIVTYLTVLMYNHMYDDMSNDKVFVILAYLNTCRFPISLLPACLSSITEFFVASRRISNYLMKNELPAYSTFPMHLAGGDVLDGDRGDRVVDAYQSQQLDDYQRIVSGEQFKNTPVDDNAQPTASENDGGDIVSPTPPQTQTEPFAHPTALSKTLSGQTHTTVSSMAPIGQPYDANIDTSAIVVNHCDFYWAPLEQDSTQIPVLGDVSISIRSGQLYGLIGGVGIGKTAFILGILGELSILQRDHAKKLALSQDLLDAAAKLRELHQIGKYFDVSQMGKYSFIGSTDTISPQSIAIFGRVGYCSQDPWLISGSLRDNITLGLDYDEEKFDQVIAAAALKQDLTVLAKGADTEVGDGGVSLSGGQRARCAFARLLYWSEHIDTVLLDDIFAAVDVAVAKTMFFQGVKGILNGKTVIMALNSHFNFLSTCDQVIALEPSCPAFMNQYKSLSTSDLYQPQQPSEATTIQDHQQQVVVASSQTDQPESHSSSLRPPSVIGFVGTFAQQLARGTAVLSTFESHAGSVEDEDEDDGDDAHDIEALLDSQAATTTTTTATTTESHENSDDDGNDNDDHIAIDVDDGDDATVENPLDDDEEFESVIRSKLPPETAQALLNDALGPDAITDASLAPDPSYSIKDSQLIQAEEGFVHTQSFISSKHHQQSIEQEPSTIQQSVVRERSKIRSKTATIVADTQTQKDGKPSTALTAAQKSDTQASNNIEARYYFSYIRGSKGTFGMCLFLFLMAITAMGAQAFRVLSDTWILDWANDSPYIAGVSDHSLDWWTASCGIIIGVCFLLFFARILTFLAVNLDASQHLHDTTFRRVLNAPMAWFDVTLLGHILNRFSKDIDTIDNILPDNLSSFTQQGLLLLGIVVLSCIATYFFVIPLIPLLFLLYWFQRRFRKTALQIRRLENISLSPVFASFAAATRGAQVIRAYNLQEYFISRHRTLVDECSRVSLISNFLQRWLAFRLDLIASIFILVISFFGVFLRSEISPSISALAITYSMQLVGSLQFAIRTYIVLQSAFTSVERLEAYFDIPQEPRYYTDSGISDALERPLDAPPLPDYSQQSSGSGASGAGGVVSADNYLAIRKRNIITRLKGWPWKCEIVFKNVSMRYRPDLPLVLNNLSVTIPSGKKVGVIGRTGAGKSSLLLVLFRMVELARGSVEIDGIDISSIGIGDLRSRMSIITQQPTMFSGTVRSNLDPFGMHSDEDIVTALQQAHIWHKVESLPDGIYSEISEAGSNISQAEKQLLCIARALILKNKIIVLDEATASVSPDTDAAIQSTIRTCFHDCTIVTIAHRLDTICDFDYVMVLGPINNDRIEQGYDDETTNSLLEFDHPYTLLSDPNSYFYRMASATGEGGYHNLLAKAKISYLASHGQQDVSESTDDSGAATATQ